MFAIKILLKTNSNLIIHEKSFVSSNSRATLTLREEFLENFKVSRDIFRWMETISIAAFISIPYYFSNELLFIILSILKSVYEWRCVSFVFIIRGCWLKFMIDFHFLFKLWWKIRRGDISAWEPRLISRFNIHDLERLLISDFQKISLILKERRHLVFGDETSNFNFKQLYYHI